MASSAPSMAAGAHPGADTAAATPSTDRLQPPRCGPHLSPSVCLPSVLRSISVTSSHRFMTCRAAVSAAQRPGQAWAHADLSAAVCAAARRPGASHTREAFTGPPQHSAAARLISVVLCLLGCVLRHKGVIVLGGTPLIHSHPHLAGLLRRQRGLQRGGRGARQARQAGEPRQRAAAAAPLLLLLHLQEQVVVQARNTPHLQACQLHAAQLHARQAREGGAAGGVRHSLPLGRRLALQRCSGAEASLSALGCATMAAVCSTGSSTRRGARHAGAASRRSPNRRRHTRPPCSTHLSSQRARHRKRKCLRQGGQACQASRLHSRSAGILLPG